MDDKAPGYTADAVDIDATEQLDPMPFEAAGVGAAWHVAFAEITRAIADRRDVLGLFSAVAEQVGYIVQHDTFAVLLFNSDGTVPAGRIVIPHCSPPVLPVGRLWSCDDFSFAPALLGNQSTTVRDFSVTAPQHWGDWVIMKTGGRSALIVPIQASPRVFGGLVLIKTAPGAYRSEDARLIEPLANLFAIALDRQSELRHATALAVIEERGRLAGAFQDTLAISLARIIENLQSFASASSTHREAEANLLTETEMLARESLEETKRSILDQSLTVLHGSLREALALDLERFTRSTGVLSQLLVQGNEHALSPAIATVALGICQEALTNIRGRTYARQVTLELTFDAQTLALTIEAEGAGSVAEMNNPSLANNVSLTNMTARVHSAGGDLQITGNLGRGTTLRCLLPYTHNETASPSAIVGTPSVDLEIDGNRAYGERSIAVLVADHHPVSRIGISTILRGQPDLRVVGEASDGLLAVKQTARLHPDVVLLDPQLPMLQGAECISRVRAAYPVVEVVVLALTDQEEQILASFKAGARGYLLKDARPVAIVEAVRAASFGQSTFPSAFTTQMMDRLVLTDEPKPLPTALTERELEVLILLEKGIPYKEIAAQLNVTTNTVQYHVTNLLRKLGARSRGEAVAAAVQLKLIGRRD